MCHYKVKSYLSDFRMNHFIQRVVDVQYGVQTLQTCIIGDKHTHVIMPAASAFLFSMTKDKGARINSVKSYAATLVSFLNTLAQDPEIGGYGYGSVTDKQMRAYLELVLIVHKEVTLNTVEQNITRLNQFYEYCWKAGLIEDRPEFSYQLSDQKMREMKIKGGIKKSLDPFNLSEQYIPYSEFNELLAYKPRVGDYENARDDIVLKLGYFVGMRAAEVVSEDNFTLPRINAAISEADKKGDKGYLLFVIGKGSNGGKPRQVYIPQLLRQQIVRFMHGARKKTPGNLLICKSDGTQLHERHASDTFSDAVKCLIKAGGEFSKSWKANKARCYHSLRHCYATNFAQYLKENNLPRLLLSERMGHADEETTLIYIHFNAVLHGDIETQNKILPLVHKKHLLES